MQILVAADGVADRRSNAKDVVAVEFNIVLDVVVVNLGPHKHVVPDVVADAGTQVLHEVIAAGVVDATAEVAALHDRWLVEARGGDADATHQVKAHFLAQLGLIQGVKVGENGTVVYVFAGIHSLAGSPGGFNIEAKTVLETGDIAADVEVSAALFRRLLKENSRVRGRGRNQCSAADKKVQLLGRREMGEEHKNRER